MKNSKIFHISAQNIVCGYPLEPPRRGGSNEYPQSMFLSRNKKNNVYPCKPQFYYIKVGFKGIKIIWACFRDVFLFNFFVRLEKLMQEGQPEPEHGHLLYKLRRSTAFPTRFHVCPAKTQVSLRIRV